MWDGLMHACIPSVVGAAGRKGAMVGVVGRGVQRRRACHIPTGRRHQRSGTEAGAGCRPSSGTRGWRLARRARPPRGALTSGGRRAPGWAGQGAAGGGSHLGIGIHLGPAPEQAGAVRASSGGGGGAIEAVVVDVADDCVGEQVAHRVALLQLVAHLQPGGGEGGGGVERREGGRQRKAQEAQDVGRVWHVGARRGHSRHVSSIPVHGQTTGATARAPLLGPPSPPPSPPRPQPSPPPHCSVQGTPGVATYP